MFTTCYGGGATPQIPFIFRFDQTTRQLFETLKLMLLYERPSPMPAQTARSMTLASSNGPLPKVNVLRKTQGESFAQHDTTA
jgi:hypothetical protein